MNCKIIRMTWNIAVLATLSFNSYGAVPAAPKATCTSNAQCNDGNPCTQDVCMNGHCKNRIMSGQTCNAGGNTCTTGFCSNKGACLVSNLPNGTTCNDGNACTQTDTCTNGTCIGSNAVVCTAQDQCHNAGTCDTTTGACSNPAKADGSACNDSNSCTQPDACQAGVCVSGASVVCTASDQCHAPGQCDATTGQCSNPAAPDGTTCDDGNACTQTDSCQSGTCAGTPISGCCQTDADCTLPGNGCDTVTHQCVFQCFDHHKDGAETDIDCGGGTCGPCGTGKICLQNSDCIFGNLCENGVCTIAQLCLTTDDCPSGSTCVNGFCNIQGG